MSVVKWQTGIFASDFGFANVDDVGDVDDLFD